MADKKSFVLYLDNKNQFDIMTDAQAGELIKALFDFAKDGEIPELSDGMVKMAFSFISAQIARDTAKYEDICKRRAEYAKASKCKHKQPKANLSKHKHTDNENENENDNENDIIINNNIDQKSPSKSAIEKEFEQLWELYPKKEGKKKALLCYQRARKNGTSFDEVMNGIKEYAEYCKNKEYRYIKQGSTYFNGECWNDVLDSAPVENQQSYDINDFDSLAVNLR